MQFVSCHSAGAIWVPFCVSLSMIICSSVTKKKQLLVKSQYSENTYKRQWSTLWRLAAFEDFRKKTPKHTWLCVGISLLLYGIRTWSKGQKTHQVFQSAFEKIFFVGGLGVFVRDVTSGGLLGHLGPLCLAQGANRQVVVFR